MGDVWEAWRDDGLRVAVKRIHPRWLGDPAARRMFLDEARIASALDHPNLVRVLDWGEIDGAEFIAMELVEGWHAQAMLNALGPVPADIALHVVAEVARGLAHAHAARDEAGQLRGIVHRDVNPPNILIGAGGRVQLSDFGIALARNRIEKTATGLVKGKEGYLAPEQVRGGAVTGAIDVYGLGASLHALVTGRAPLSGWKALSRRALGGPLELDPSLGAELSAIVAEAMALRPTERPSARELAARADAATSCVALAAAESPAIRLERWLAPLAAAKDGALDNLFHFDVAPTER
jgi:serine/threonine-protein kinase